MILNFYSTLAVFFCNAKMYTYDDSALSYILVECETNF